MASVIRIWEVNEHDKLTEVPQVAPQDQGTIEKQIEAWLEGDPDAVMDDLLVIGRQVRTDSGPLDLLGVSSEGDLVVIELKRDRAPREVVAQALDYASWLSEQSVDQILEIAEGYLHAGLATAFQTRFGEELPDLNFARPAVRVVASRLDAATERMISYLASTYDMDIDGIIVRHVTLSTGVRLLVRTSVNPEAVLGTRRDAYSRPTEVLLESATARGTRELVDTLRNLGTFLGENPTRTYGGSFRYWGYSRMLCGVNVAANWDAPNGTVDVWVSYGSWAQATGLDEHEGILQPLDAAGFKRIRHYERLHQMVYRIENMAGAQHFVELTRSWFEGSEAPGPD